MSSRWLLALAGKMPYIMCVMCRVNIKALKTNETEPNPEEKEGNEHTCLCMMKKIYLKS